MAEPDLASPVRATMPWPEGVNNRRGRPDQAGPADKLIRRLAAASPRNGLLTTFQASGTRVNRCRAGLRLLFPAATASRSCIRIWPAAAPRPHPLGAALIRGIAERLEVAPGNACRLTRTLFIICIANASADNVLPEDSKTEGPGGAHAHRQDIRAAPRHSRRLWPCRCSAGSRAPGSRSAGRSAGTAVLIRVIRRSASACRWMLSLAAADDLPARHSLRPPSPNAIPLPEQPDGRASLPAIAQHP